MKFPEALDLMIKGEEVRALDTNVQYKIANDTLYYKTDQHEHHSRASTSLSGMLDRNYELVPKTMDFSTAYALLKTGKRIRRLAFDDDKYVFLHNETDARMHGGTTLTTFRYGFTMEDIEATDWVLK